MNKDRKQFGVERIKESFNEFSAQEPNYLIEKITENFKTFLVGENAKDM